MTEVSEATAAGTLLTTARTLCELLVGGPIEVTSVLDEEHDARAHRAQLLSLLAAGVWPGAYYGEWTPWPVDLLDSAAIDLPAWIVDRHEVWPATDPGGLFESVGLAFWLGGTRRDGSRRMPYREPHVVMHGRSWATATANEEPWPTESACPS
ncbi:hypothetical protein [Stackebrandtia soli]|uniref:hypothetical protein n=1 Tax=Stackebrandtia soli TaxID=1892856 RepID=UPI0039E91159